MAVATKTKLTDEQVAEIYLKYKKWDAATAFRKWCPDIKLTPRQQVAYHRKERETCFGGSVGPGKSFLLCIKALGGVECPMYNAVLFRRISDELTAAGGLIDKMHQILGDKPFKYNKNEKKFFFPSGATITFSHFQYEKTKHKHQGSEFNFIGFDELSTFEEEQFLYMFSRLRKKKNNPYPLQVFSTCNPGSLWVKKRYIDYLNYQEGDFNEVYTDGDRCFVPAELAQNEHLDKEDYLNNLENLSSIEKQYLLHGKWSVTVDSIFKKDYFNKRWVEQTPEQYIIAGVVRNIKNDPVVIYIDTASTESDTACNSAIGIVRYCGDLILIEEVWADKVSFNNLCEKVKHFYTKYNIRKAYIENANIAQPVMQMLKEQGVILQPLPTKVDGYSLLGDSAKLNRASKLIAMSEQGKIIFPVDSRGDWISLTLDELAFFTGKKTDKADRVDVLAYAANQKEFTSTVIIKKEFYSKPLV